MGLDGIQRGWGTHIAAQYDKWANNRAGRVMVMSIYGGVTPCCGAHHGSLKDVDIS